MSTTIDQRLAQLEDEKNRLKAKKRKEITREKIVFGSLMMSLHKAYHYKDDYFDNLLTYAKNNKNFSKDIKIIEKIVNELRPC